MTIKFKCPWCEHTVLRQVTVRYSLTGCNGRY